MPFFRDEKIGGQVGNLQTSFFRKSADQNFEIAILFNTVKKTNNHMFEDDLISNSL